MRKFIIGLIALAAFLFLAFILGPKANYEGYDDQLPAVEDNLALLDQNIQEREKQISNLRPDNEARIVWADSIRQTPYALVYLHGFSASPMEAAPIHQEFAKRYGCNMYLARLAAHGLEDVNAFANLTPKAIMDSAEEALAIGQKLGEKVILMSCSTGSTLAIYLAAKYPDAVASHIMYSPNIKIYDERSDLLIGPWGRQLAAQLVGDYHEFTVPSGAENYWTTKYSTEGLVCVSALVKSTMQPAIFKKINQPLFVGYYYKNEEESDHVVSIPAIKDFFETVSTPEALKEQVAFPDVDSHVIPCGLQSKDLDSVRKATFAFAEKRLKLVPLAN